MTPSTRASWMGTALLVAAMALPLYTCDGYRAPDGRVVTEIPAGGDSGGYRPMKIKHYPLEKMKVREPDTWPPVLAFLWPVPFLAVRLRRRGAGGRVVVPVAEAVLAAASAVYVEALRFGDPATGYFVAMAGNLLCGGAGVASVVTAIHERRSRRAASPG